MIPRREKFNLEFIRKRVQNMGEDKNSIGTLSKLPRDILYKITAQRKLQLLLT